MTGTQRRLEIIAQLEQADSPLSGAALGESLGVSRQVIVQDIALLRADGHAIGSTNRGYYLVKSARPLSRLIKVRHGVDRIEEEMNLIVDLGGCVEDVMVNHRTYGQMRASLDVRSRRDVKRFLEDLATGVSDPLASITSGYHFHRISADSEEILDEIEAALAETGFTAEWTEFEKTNLA